MANTPQYAFRLPPEHIELLERRAARLAERLGAPISRTDALKMLLDFMQKVERIRDARIASYNEHLRVLPLDDPERDRIQQARDDWEIMPYERFLNRAELLAVGSAAVDEIRRSARTRGLDRLSGAEIDAEIQEVRRSRTRRR
jgi:hypothetical protein